MTQREQALQMLGRIGLSDRQWILQQLSADARQRLIQASEPAGQAPQREADLPQDVQLERLSAALAPAPAGQMVELLHLEPAWLVAAILNVQPWPWAREFLAALPPPTRFEVTHAARRGARLSSICTLSALQELARRTAGLGESNDKRRAVPRFEKVLARIRRGTRW